MKYPPIDWSVIVEGKKVNPFLKILINAIRKVAPSLFRKFPWKVSVLKIIEFKAVNKNSIAG